MSDYSRNNNTPGAQGGKTTGAQPKNSKNRKLKVISKNGPVRLFADPNSDTIEAIAELRTNGYMRQLGAGMELFEKCEETIDALGFTMVETKELSPGLTGGLKDFSLIGSTNIDETIQNSKIVDPDLRKLTPVNELATDKFKDESDSFYDLDQERPQSIKNKQKKEKVRSNKARATTRVAARLTVSVKKSPNKMLDKSSKRSIKR
jgi:hypothetical protein